MSDELLKPNPEFEKAKKGANPFERAGIWGSYHFLNYLERLGQKPVEKLDEVVPVYHPRPKRAHPSNHGKFVKTALETTVIGGIVLFLGGVVVNMYIDRYENSKQSPASRNSQPIIASEIIPIATLTPPPETQAQERSKYLNQKDLAITYRYGVLASKMDFLGFRAYPDRLNSIIEQAGLDWPAYQVVFTHILPNRIQDPLEQEAAKQQTSSDITNSDYVRYFRLEQGIEPTKVVMAPLSFANVSTAGGLSGNLNLEFAKEWLRSFKRSLRGADAELTESEIELLTAQNPFVISYYRFP